jgi:hypothetical protein
MKKTSVLASITLAGFLSASYSAQAAFTGGVIAQDPFVSIGSDTPSSDGGDLVIVTEEVIIADDLVALPAQKKCHQTIKRNWMREKPSDRTGTCTIFIQDWTGPKCGKKDGPPKRGSSERGVTEAECASRTS